MEPSSDAAPSQTTPIAQVEPAVQAEPVATSTNAEALPSKPNDKTKIASSSTANGSTDLVFDIKAMFESSKQLFSIGGLNSVPNHLRKVDEQAFTPLFISIGPIHYYNAKLRTMKQCKVRFCECLIQRANIDLQNLIFRIRLTEKKIRSCYAETVVSSISSDDFVTMILVDGMFILVYFLSRSHLLKDDCTISIPDWMHPFLQSDLVLLENQLPFFVLEMLFQQLAKLELNYLSLMGLAFKSFERYNFHKMAFEDFHADIEHFTDLVRIFYISESIRAGGKFGILSEDQELDRFRTGVVTLVYSAAQLHVAGVVFKKAEGAKLAYSATQLHVAGVVFKKVEEFRGLGFDKKNGVMEIPCITLDDEKIRLIRNIIALEQSRDVWLRYVTDFFIMLNSLIDNSKDVDLLCDKGILINDLGNSNAAASAVNGLNANILCVSYNQEYSEMFIDLKEFYIRNITWHGWWYEWRATLWHQYFSTPWRSASTSAAIMLLLFTAIQTVCSLKSTKW